MLDVGAQHAAERARQIEVGDAVELGNQAHALERRRRDLAVRVETAGQLEAFAVVGCADHRTVVGERERPIDRHVHHHVADRPADQRAAPHHVSEIVRHPLVREEVDRFGTDPEFLRDGFGDLDVDPDDLAVPLPRPWLEIAVYRDAQHAVRLDLVDRCRCRRSERHQRGAGQCAAEKRPPRWSHDHSSECFVSSQERIAQPAFCPRTSPIGGMYTLPSRTEPCWNRWMNHSSPASPTSR